MNSPIEVLKTPAVVPDALMGLFNKVTNSIPNKHYPMWALETHYCKYDATTVATEFCESCHAPLCEICGYEDADGTRYCNECWDKYNDTKRRPAC